MANKTEVKPAKPPVNWVARVAGYVLVAVIAFVAGNHTTDLVALMKGKSGPSNLDLSSVQDLYDKLRVNFDGQLDAQKLIDGAKHGLVSAAGDPHTVYFTAEEAKEFMNDVNNTFSGIGAEIGKQDDKLIVVSPLDGSPAKQAGLKPGDVIAKVNGEATDGWSIEKAVSKIRGPALTTVKLSVIRDGQLKEISITRQDITAPSVSHKVLDGNIGYLRISTFAQNTADDARAAALSLKKQHVKGVILDLRSNGGGYLDAGQGVASIWLKDNQTVVTERTGDKVTMKLTALGDPILADMPTVVLVDGGTASASEIVAAALRDNGKAKLVGTKTYGKGTVQEPIKLDDGGVLKVTVHHWYTPNDQSIDGNGLKPDKQVKPTEQDIKQQNDVQLKAAEELLK
ncbi:MAG TPA: S41 family peptidase [Candidatus Saccharimonadales bacterium]|nr:S41 family peptidase [Candidatus Saccharimonadales bacterium]